MLFHMNPTRREFLKIGAAGAALGGVSLTPTDAAVAASKRPIHGVMPRNVIFMVSDGMSVGVPSLAEPFSQLVRNRPTHWGSLSKVSGTVHGHIDMAALDSLVTDSAAAASSWATGSRVNNGSINTLPDGTTLTPIGVLAKDTGRRVGLVTSTRVTHATPAGFASCVPSRSMEQEIAPQYLDVVDVLLGGGEAYFDEDLRAAYERSGYQMFFDRQGLVTVRGMSERVLGIFSRSHFPYVIDTRQLPVARQSVPSLAEMTRAALLSLASSERGFLLMVEGGRVDHAAHANDAAALMWEQLDFDDAIGVVLEYVKERDDTLVLLTSDHANANPGLNGMGSGYRGSTPAFHRLSHVTASFSSIERSLLNAADPESIIEVLSRHTRIEIDAREAAVLHEVAQSRPVPELNRSLSSLRGQLGQVLGNYTGVTFTSVYHTADWVMSMAVGPGSDRFAGLLRNTDVYTHLAGLMEITHRNPVFEGIESSRRGVR